MSESVRTPWFLLVMDLVPDQLLRESEYEILWPTWPSVVGNSTSVAWLLFVPCWILSRVSCECYQPRMSVSQVRVRPVSCSLTNWYTVRRSEGCYLGSIKSPPSYASALLQVGWFSVRSHRQNVGLKSVNILEEERVYSNTSFGARLVWLDVANEEDLIERSEDKINKVFKLPGLRDSVISFGTTFSLGKW